MAAKEAEPPAAPPPEHQHLFDQFFDFLRTYGVLGLAIAFVIGEALNRLVQAVVRGLIMPLVAPLLPGKDWREAEAFFGPVGPILYGEVIYAFLYFLIIAGVVFLIARYILRQKQVKKI